MGLCEYLKSIGFDWGQIINGVIAAFVMLVILGVVRWLWAGNKFVFSYKLLVDMFKRKVVLVSNDSTLLILQYLSIMFYFIVIFGFIIMEASMWGMVSGVVLDGDGVPTIVTGLPQELLNLKEVFKEAHFLIGVVSALLLYHINIFVFALASYERERKQQGKDEATEKS